MISQSHLRSIYFSKFRSGFIDYKRHIFQRSAFDAERAESGDREHRDIGFLSQKGVKNLQIIDTPKISGQSKIMDIPLKFLA